MDLPLACCLKINFNWTASFLGCWDLFIEAPAALILLILWHPLILPWTFPRFYGFYHLSTVICLLQLLLHLL